ncbi:outer membrane protein transport protein [Desulfothermus naphthae]
MKKLWLIGFILCLLTSSAFGGMHDRFEQGGKATGLAGAYAAYANDVYAMYFNPAGLTQLKGPQFAVGVLFANLHLEQRDFTVEKGGEIIAGPVDYEDSTDVLEDTSPAIGFGMPINDRIAAGILVNVPFGVRAAWNEKPSLTENPGAYNAFKSWHYRVAVTPTVAFKVNRKLSLGFGISIGYGVAGTYLHSYPMRELLTSLGGTGNVREEVEATDTSNYSFNFGLMYKINKKLTFGLTYRGMSHMVFSGELKLKNISPTDKAILAQLGINKYKTDVNILGLHFPRQVQMGLRYAPNSRFSIEGDLVWTQWSINDTQVVEIKDPVFQSALGGSKIYSDRDWKDTTEWKIGVEWKATDILTLRAGYFYAPTAVPDYTYDLVWPDSDKHIYTIGAGIQLNKKWHIDGAIEYATIEQDNRMIAGESNNLNQSFMTGMVPNEPEARVSVEEKGYFIAYSISVTYNF